MFDYFITYSTDLIWLSSKRYRANKPSDALAMYVDEFPDAEFRSLMTRDGFEANESLAASRAPSGPDVIRVPLSFLKPIFVGKA